MASTNLILSAFGTTFKVARETDINTIKRFMQELYELDGDIPFEDQIAQTALEKIVRDNVFGYVWLIQHSDEAVGYVILTLGYSLEYHGRDAFLDEIYVEADYRGQGIGKQALHFVEETCRSLGVNALHLEVERDNISAQHVYRKFGFEDHDRYLMTKWIK
jgi:GNAT superfamily N-acetyltransferase